MPPSLTTKSPSSNSNSDPKLESNSTTTASSSRFGDYFKAQAELRAKKHPPLKKNPSIERFLGSSHDEFKHSVDSRTRSVSSLQDSEAETGQSFARDSILKAPKRSSAGGPSVTPDEGGRSEYELHTTLESPESVDVIKTVRMPKFPIRVFQEDPPPFSLELQRAKMRWRRDWFGTVGVAGVQDPSTDSIQDTARPYIVSIAPEAKIISVTLLARGSFNIAYNITAENCTTGFQQNYVFRVSLPIWPYYKVESDVATTEFVRHATSIPVPIIYAFDSNPVNKLGFEWMLMERVQGKPLRQVWDTMGFDTKQGLVRRIANSMAELSQYKFKTLGSIFMRYRQRHIDFYIGPSVHEKLFERDRLLYDVDRGPFKSVQALYDVILDLTERHVNDTKHRVRQTLEDTKNGELELNHDSPSAEITRETHALMSDSLEAALARADAEDEENMKEGGWSKDMLSWLPSELQEYRTMLPQIFALLPAAEPLVTFLMHPDLQEANIFVDNANNLVALIDWERARLEPIALVDFMPKFLDDGEPDTFYVPSRTSVPEVEGNIALYDYEKLAYARGLFESSYKALMLKIQKTRLRTVYRDEMIRLKSPLCERDPEDLEQELMCRIYYADVPGNTRVAHWMREHLGESVDDESDDDTEPEREAQSAEDE